MDRRRRIEALAIALLLLAAALGIQATTASPADQGAIDSSGEAYPGVTLITVQSFDSFSRNNGEAMIVSPNGMINWRFDPPDTRVFDAEMIDENTVMVSMATRRPASECPEPFDNTDPNPAICVENRVVEVDTDTNQIGWNYTWYDVWVQDHEVHDADRLDNGNTAIVDMGNDRAFVVNPEGEIVWKWNATERIGPGSDFWNNHVPDAEKDRLEPVHPEADWTHINDIDAVRGDNLLLSIRNFDVILEVEGETGDIVNVTGTPGDGLIDEQHDPNHLGGPDTMLVADSVNNRVIEIDPATGDRLWEYTGTDRRLQWPRDADRLPNGNTLIVDSRNFRVLEVNATGHVVWEYSLEIRQGIVYDADRVGLAEEPDNVPDARSFPETETVGPIASSIGFVESWAAVIFPPWVRISELFTIAAMLVLGVLLGIDLIGYYRST